MSCRRDAVWNKCVGLPKDKQPASQKWSLTLSDEAHDHSAQRRPDRPQRPQRPHVRQLCCIDCGMNTAPGTPPRRLMAFLFQQAGMDAEVKSCITWDSEVYTVRDSVWKKAGIAPMGGCLCIGCLERRIGRRLEPKDFPADDAFNHPDLPGTERLLNRRSR